MWITNPARATLRYMRGEDIKEANERTIAANLALAATAAAAARSAPAVSNVSNAPASGSAAARRAR
jgi:hypothetical protein